MKINKKKTFFSEKQTKELSRMFHHLSKEKSLKEIED